jgi:hypothetical protein
MKAIPRDSYLLLISHNPCDIFDYFNVDEMHGLNKVDCERHINNTEQSYIAGWSNFIPNTEDRFVFINLSRCTITLIMHELMHHSLWLHGYDVENSEEEIISWAELETIEINKLL